MLESMTIVSSWMKKKPKMTTNPSDLSTLDDQSLEVLIQHYLSVAEKLPDSVTVRDRLIELQDELLNRQINNEE